ncbi:MAG TPA: hypothetical protein PKV66_00645 [Candidatus Pelethenecus sp.]|nr:hypothetical protein [Candidatus Pelethenecus sp.]
MNGRNVYGKEAYNFKGGAYSIYKPEGNSYRAMKNRCLTPSYRAYHRYGGRGIKICDRWLGKDGFKNFLEDMGRKPSAKHSLERIDGDGDYTPDNCKWATEIEQKNNTSRNRYETINGETLTVAQWCRKYNVKTHTITNRMRTGWTFEAALTTPVNTVGKRFYK